MGKNKYVEVLDYRKSAQENILKVIKSHRSSGKSNKVPVKLRDYQEQAISSWVNNDYHGFYVMATGTGKTWTAIYSAKALIEKHPCMIVICAPYKHLVKQWAEDVQKAFPNGKIILVSSENPTWEVQINNEIIAQTYKPERQIIIISTIASFKMERFTNVISKSKQEITQEELNEKILQLKEEEKKRENWNTILKRWANDIIPFVMVKDQIEEVKRQINSENDYLKYKNFCEILESESILAILNNQNLSLDLVESTAKKEYGNNNNHILDLSLEQSSALLSQLNTILNFNAEKIVKCKTLIKRSLKIAAQIRKELENSSVDSVQEYMKNRAALLEKKSLLLNNQIELEQELQAKSDREIQTEGEFKKAQVILEEELKRASINDIAAKSIVMLDKLQAILYHKQISRVESFFRKEISTLMRKTNFIDDIHIDDDFNIHIYRNETISFSKILETVYSNSQDQLISLFGEAAINKIMLAAPSGNIFDAMEQLKMRRITALVLPIEIDTTSLSNGEKQIFIMAVYHSLVQLCTHDIPFIIDTPFARIDTEHRKNISKYFFSKLNGQVFILSTNEEINSEHVKIMKNKILAKYMLENTDNKRTLVEKNTYFEG